MKRGWRRVVCGSAAWALAGSLLGVAPAPAVAARRARAGERIVLELPASMAIRKIEAAEITVGADRELQADGPATVELANGFRLIARRARLSFALQGANGTSRIFVEPLPDAVIEMVVPAGRVRVIAGVPTRSPGNPGLIRWYGKLFDGVVDVGLADDVWLLARDSRVSALPPDRDQMVHLLIEPARPSPATR